MVLRGKFVLCGCLFLFVTAAQQTQADPIPITRGRAIFSVAGSDIHHADFSSLEIGALNFVALADNVTFLILPRPDVLENGRAIDLSSHVTFESPGFLLERASISNGPLVFQSLFFTGNFTFAAVPSVLTVCNGCDRFPSFSGFFTSSGFRFTGMLTGADLPTRQNVFQTELIGSGEAFGFFHLDRGPSPFLELDYHFHPTPEPATLALFGFGVAAVGRTAWRRRRRAPDNEHT